MPSTLTRRLAAAAVLFGGLLAGVTAHRALVQMPAWEHVGLGPWAAFMRAEAAGPGLFFYPVLGLAALLSTAATAVACHLDRGARDVPRVVVVGAALLAIGWASITRTVLVPSLARLAEPGISVADLGTIFRLVARWDSINDALHVLTFMLNVWVLTKVYGSQERPVPA
jgi:hypothetical protein